MATTVICRGGLVLQTFPRHFMSKAVCGVTARGPMYIQAICVPCQQSRDISSSIKRQQPVKDTPTETKQNLSVENKENTRESFVPITRRSVIRHLMEEKNLLTPEELKGFETLSLSLDSAIVNKYHGALQELKSLFDPINPDKDTITTRKWNRRERLDNEFWLIQTLASVMLKANFKELSRVDIEKALAEHEAGEGVLVSVDINKYDVLRFWVLGKQTPVQRPSLAERLVSLIKQKPLATSMEYYKRVIVAVRLKRDDKLSLKAFKEVPVNALEQLLPNGKIKMTKFDHGLMVTATGFALIGILGKVVTHLAHVDVDWTLIITIVTGLVGFRAWTIYHIHRNNYLLDLNRMLYFKNIANNRGLLALIVDRAEDELFKQCLLTYTFLLTNRSPSVQEKSSSDQLPAELGSMPQKLLELNIQDWVHRKTNSKIYFNAEESIKFLSDLGILSEDYDKKLHVLPLVSATRNLPLAIQTLSARKEEYDIVEGYDKEKDVLEETYEEYAQEEKRRKLFGWF